jgi:hypothetical protein
VKYDERDILCKRIACGVLYGRFTFDGSEVSFAIKDPSQSLLNHSNFIYDQVVEENAAELPTQQEYLDMFRHNGMWLQKSEDRVNYLKSQIERMKKELSNSKFFVSKSEETRRQIAEYNKEIETLLTRKYSVSSFSLEGYAEEQRRVFLLNHSVISISRPELLENHNFIRRLAVYYFVEKDIPECHYRELARTNPWRVYWTVSKETGTSLFSGPSTEMTAQQFMLCSWTSTYDVAFNSMDRPTDEVIDDDILFDNWIEEQQKKAKSKKDESSRTVNGKKSVASNVFVPSDRAGARKIYEQNTPEARKIVQERQSLLLKGNKVSEVGFKDVKQTVQMAANQEVSRRMQKGKK